MVLAIVNGFLRKGSISAFDWLLGRNVVMLLVCTPTWLSKCTLISTTTGGSLIGEALEASGAYVDIQGEDSMCFMMRGIYSFISPALFFQA